MHGEFQEGWYKHPSLGIVKIFRNGDNWVYQCYTTNQKKALSHERPLDTWTWALCEGVREK
ncbi:MAG: hypothetical protein ACQES8_00695 [Thermodesulfobacteriota bacterium]